MGISVLGVNLVLGVLRVSSVLAICMQKTYMKSVSENVREQALHIYTLYYQSAVIHPTHIKKIYRSIQGRSSIYAFMLYKSSKGSLHNRRPL